MTTLIVAGAIILIALLVLVIVAGQSPSDGEEQGPMPRNHGGFGSGPSRSGHK